MAGIRGWGSRGRNQFKIRLEKFALSGNQRQSPAEGNPPAALAPPGNFSQNSKLKVSSSSSSSPSSPSSPSSSSCSSSPHFPILGCKMMCWCVKYSVAICL
ncbi:MAG: hypothetical protein KME57_13745 [Scytonema hyalinum WJT4-NPBG1]|nr:hypothetical protein [Scytonema hyalinum WJT4-NPBG1]